ncbi:MAG TPA: RNA ligase RtcB family protein [Plasticicumulans sp.]|nr:RNA ligase RtcB family protein [Plasticicumulans sp.]
MNTEITSPPAPRIIAAPDSWIEGTAVQQLEAVAALPGMQRAVGMPDLHPGKVTPIGAAFASVGLIHPALVGNDIGCGMGLWTTELKRAKAKPAALAGRLHGLDGPWDGDTAARLAAAGLAPTVCDAALGTIGGGNHFAELQAIEAIHDAPAVAALGLEAERLLLLVHSGSRGLGEHILRAHVERHGHAPLAADSDDGRAYLEQHEHARRWAIENRALIAARISDCLRTTGERRLDVCHNSVSAALVDGCACWLHRKGAAPADAGPVVVPGSRGSFSYLVQPVPDSEATLYSIAHGAGRRWKRSDTRARLQRRFTADDLTRTALGSEVVCEDRELLYEEAPPAYKDIDTVIRDLVDAGLARVLAVLRPLVTYKLRARVRA